MYIYFFIKFIYEEVKALNVITFIIFFLHVFNNKNIKLLISRKLYKVVIVYYFDVFEDLESGIRFIKISEVEARSRKRSHILVALDDANHFIKILGEGLHKQEIDDINEPFAVFEESNVLEEKTYEFTIWSRKIRNTRVHIDIRESGRAYPNLIKNRDPEEKYGVFGIIVSQTDLMDFIRELEDLILDIYSM